MNLKTNVEDKFGLILVFLMALFVLTIAFFVTDVTSPLATAGIMMLVCITMAIFLCVYLLRTRKVKRDNSDVD